MGDDDAVDAAPASAGLDAGTPSEAPADEAPDAPASPTFAPPPVTLDRAEVVVRTQPGRLTPTEPDGASGP